MYAMLILFKTQSARGENQNPNRPGSGYGSSATQAQGGPSGAGASSSGIAGGVSGGAPGGAPQPSGYQNQQEPTANNLLGAQLENTEPDNNPYANVYPPGGAHNGTSDEPY